mgnify:CR=1 FL=1
MRSISTRIIALLGLLVFVVCFGLGIAAYMTSYNALMNNLENSMPKFAIEASITIRDGIQKQFDSLSMIASLKNLEIIADPYADISSCESVLSNETKRAGHKRMILVDRNGRAVYDNGKIDNMKGNALFEKAVAGENVVSQPMYDSDKSSIIMFYAVPIRANNEVVGVLMAVRDGLELSEFANRIQYGKTGEAFIVDGQGRTIAHANKELMLQIIDKHSTDVNSSATIELNTVANDSTENKADVNSSATIVKEENGDSNFSFEKYIEFQDKMLKGEAGFQEYKYNGVAKVAGFAPIEGYDWSIAVTADKEEVLSGLTRLKLAFILISFAFLIIGFAVAYFIGTSISKPIVALTEQCKVMSNGDFTKTMGDMYTKRLDEIGDLARGFNQINVNVSDIIRNVITEANSVNKAIQIVNDNMAGLTDDIKVMSNIIQQLSSKMEETSAMAEEMNATSLEIENAIDSIANKAQEGAESANVVSERAKRLKTTAINSQKNARDIRLDVDLKLREAIEQSKAVDQISILSDVILQIASRTNLLALNAKIEAVQSNASGKGFSVVAEEITKLAEHSKQTANEIQEITKKVIESVQNLSVSAEQVLEFLENKVLKDYDMFVETGEQYNDDAMLIDEMVADFSATSEQLYASVQGMVSAITDVASAAEKGAAETSEMAEEAEVIVNRTNEVLKQTHAVNESSNKLLDIVSLFKV